MAKKSTNPFTSKTFSSNERLSELIPLQSPWQCAYAAARKDFESGQDFEPVVRQVGELVREILIELLKTVLWSSDSKLRDLVDNAIEKHCAEKKAIPDLSLTELGMLLDDRDTGLFGATEQHLGEYFGVLSTYNYEGIGVLVEQQGQLGRDRDSKKASAHQLLNLTSILLAAYEGMTLTAYHFLVNFYEITREVERLRQEQTKTNDAKTEYSYLPIAENAEDERQFVWYKQRGMLLNKADQSRNIAFKVETFVNILRSIYTGITANTIPHIDEGKTIGAIATQIIFDAGYKSGVEFGWTMHEIAQRKDFADGDIESIIRLWCEFDSDVGFGMLSLVPSEEAEGIKNTENNQLKYTIRLTDNFAVYKQDAQDINLCSFVSGYIQGVMERLTGQPMTIDHKPDACAQFIANRNCCDFDVNTNSEKYRKILDLANANHKETSSNRASIEDERPNDKNTE